MTKYRYDITQVDCEVADQIYKVKTVELGLVWMNDKRVSLGPKKLENI